MSLRVSMRVRASHPVFVTVLAVLIITAGGWRRGLRAEEIILAPTWDGWIRAEDDFVRQADYISVWSAAFGARYGLLQFDLAPLAGRTLVGAILELYSPVTGSSSDLEPLRQATFVIDTQGGTTLESNQLTWDVYAVEYEGRETPLETLGAYDLGPTVATPAIQNVYIPSIASAADLAVLQAIADGPTARLNLVFKTIEDGVDDYKGDWGDMEATGGSLPPRLRVQVLSPPACQVTRDPLPVAMRGQPYAASLVAAGACPEGVQVEISACFLPPGLVLHPADGQITGQTQYSGVFPLDVRLRDPQGAIIDEADVDLVVAGNFETRADLDQDGDVDLLDFDRFATAFTGPMAEAVACDPGPAPDGEIVLPAVGDIWIRESDGSERESDWVSVWSSASNDGGVSGRRYGLLEFDVSPLAGLPLAAAHLSLWVGDDYSGLTRPIRQKAYVIDSSDTPLVDLTWETYHAEKDAGRQPLESLGAFDQPAPVTNGTAGTYVDDPGASAADLALIAAEATGDGLLSIVMIAEEDGTDYRADWGDGTNAGGPGLSEKPGLLRVLTGPPCYIATTTLPDGAVGQAYAASLTAAAGCSNSLLWKVSACSLPQGMTLNPQTGQISGTPALPGLFRMRVRLTDSALGISRERDLSIRIRGRAPGDIDSDGDVDRDDFARLQASFTGPLDPDLELCWRAYVTRTLDTLIHHGRDRYGPVHTNMLAAILDVNTLSSPEFPPLLDADVRTEGRPDHGRRSPGGSNLWLDAPTLHTMYRASEITGNPAYVDAADAYMSDCFQYAVKSTGLLNWGSHVYYHLFSDQAGGDGNGTGPHEILIQHAPWDQLYRVNPTATRNEVDAIWTWHICDKDTGRHNRHGDGHCALDFAFSGGSFILAFASLYALTGEQVYLDRARLVADWHWQHRDAITGLLMDAPSAGERYDAHHSFTSVTGPFAAQLLRASEISGDPIFRDQAISYIKAYDHYGWDAAAGTYHAMLRLDGTPVVTQGSGAGYDQYIPHGHVDIWRTIMYSYEFPLVAAQAALYAWELSDTGGGRDPELLAIARRWAQAIEADLPPRLGDRWKTEIEAAMPGVLATGGTYAENYGRAISFFVNLYHATGENRFLRRARVLGREAVSKLYVNGIFRGHPAKDLYQANDGVGYLLHALLQLDAVPQPWRLAF